MPILAPCMPPCCEMLSNRIFVYACVTVFQIEWYCLIDSCLVISKSRFDDTMGQQSASPSQGENLHEL